MTRDRLSAWRAELSQTHSILLDDIALIRTSIARGTPAPELARDLRVFCAGFCTVLTRHHTSEDDDLFPALLASDPSLERIIGKLQQDHDMIATLIVGLERALETLPVDQLLSHVDGLEAIMTSHFRFEEREVLPALRATNRQMNRDATC